MAEQQAQTRMTKDWLAGMEQEEAELQTKVRRLEMYVSSAPGSITELQVPDSRNQLEWGFFVCVLKQVYDVVTYSKYTFISLPVFRRELRIRVIS